MTGQRELTAFVHHLARMALTDSGETATDRQAARSLLEEVPLAEAVPQRFYRLAGRRAES